MRSSTRNPDPHVRRRIGDRIGGPWALSLPVGLLAFIPAGIAALFDATRHGGSPAAWVACGIAANAVLMVTLIPFRRWLLPGHGSRPARPVATIVVYLVAGAVRGTVVAWFAVSLGLMPTYEWGFRQLAGALIATTVLSALTMLVDGVATYRAYRGRLSRERDALARVERTAAVEIERAASMVRERLLAELRTRLSETDDAGAIDKAIDEVITPLVDDLRAHRRFLTTTEGAPPVARLSAREVLAASLRIDPYHPTAVAVGLGATLFALLAFSLGLLAGITATAVLCGFTALPLLAARIIDARTSRAAGAMRLPLVAGAYLGLAVAAVAGTAVILRAAEPDTLLGNTGYGLAAAFVTLTAIFINATTATASAAASLADIADREATSALASRAWAAARAEEAVRVYRRQLAGVVHGPVQASLIRASAALNQTDGDRSAAERAYTEIAEAIATAEASGATEVHLGTALRGLAALWDGVTAVSIHDDGALAEIDHDAICAGTLLEIAHEGVSNAVRHAGAHRVDVRVSADGAIATIVVSSDARRLPDGDRRGFGTDMLDRVCLSWERSLTAAGSELVARVPLKPRGTPV